jgi:hypothetical protein
LFDSVIFDDEVLGLEPVDHLAQRVFDQCGKQDEVSLRAESSFLGGCGGRKECDEEEEKRAAP